MIFYKFFHKKQQGFTIIELIATIAILAFGIIGAYSAFSPLVSVTYNISNKLSAVYLAQEGMEIVRNLRDNNFINNQSWSLGLLDCDVGCQLDYKTSTTEEQLENQLKDYNPLEFLKVGNDGFYSYDAGGTNSIFKRKVTITQEEGTEALRVVVDIYWIYAGKSYSYQTIGYLYNWY